MIEVVSTLSTGGWPLRLLTLDDWDAMGEDELHHVEVSEGVLVVVPRPSFDHQVAMNRLVNALNAGLAGQLVAVAEMDVVIEESPVTVRAPDVVVVDLDSARARPKRWAASEVLLAVEIMSEGSRRMDRVTKASEYAEAGIAEYWTVDLSPPTTLSCFGLAASGRYEPLGRHTGSVGLPVGGREVVIDLDELTAL